MIVPSLSPGTAVVTVLILSRRARSHGMWLRTVSHWPRISTICIPIFRRTPLIGVRVHKTKCLLVQSAQQPSRPLKRHEYAPSSRRFTDVVSHEPRNAVRGLVPQTDHHIAGRTAQDSYACLRASYRPLLISSYPPRCSLQTRPCAVSRAKGLSALRTCRGPAL